jgi:hypothetical protein
MKTPFLPALALSLIVCGSAHAAGRDRDQPPQDAYRAPNSFQGKAVVLPIGTSFEGRIQQTICSSGSRQGERFTVEISAPVLANGSDVLIPSGSEIYGEVVEAISSSSQPHDKNMPKPMGKLRVQLMSIKLTSGVTYPLVASLAGEINNSKSRGLNAARKSSIAYVGSQAGFDAVNPALQRKRDPRTGQLAVLKREDLLSDPILGEAKGGEARGNGGSGSYVRSLTRRGRDLIIYSGSPLTIRLDAPLKLSFAASEGQASIESNDYASSVSEGKGKRFAKERPEPPANGQAYEGSQNAPGSSGTSGGSGTGAPKQPGSDF